jgi:hypothetical protein
MTERAVITNCIVVTKHIVIPSNARDLGFRSARAGRTFLSVAFDVDSDFGFDFDLDSDREGHGLHPCRPATTKMEPGFSRRGNPA